MNSLQITRQDNLIFVLASVITILSCLAAVYFKLYYAFLIPLGLLFSYFCIADFKKIYYLLLLLLPLTAEVSLPNGLAIDLPAEPIMIVLMTIFFFYLITQKLKKQYIAFVKHPLAQLVLIHFTWILISVLFSSIFIIAFKFFLAKLWYIVVFFFLTGLIIQYLKDFKTAFWLILIPTIFAILLTLTKHAITGFEFDKINMAVKPFFRNHVNYAAFLTLFFPYLWIAASWYKRQSSERIFLLICRGLFIIAIIFSYTRGAWLALLLGLVFYFLAKKKLLQYTLIFIVCTLIAAGTFLIKDNTYLKYAPDYATTIYHGNIKDHLKATGELKDISSAERIYRWVAAFRMSLDKPITGFGPNNFHSNYKKHTITSFTTYVSDNPEKSGVHNYFLMILTEQGFIGLIIFLTLTFFLFHYGLTQYHKCNDKKNKAFLMVIMISLFIIYTQLLLSDLIEAIKIGSFFFINIALLINFSRNKERSNA